MISRKQKLKRHWYCMYNEREAPFSQIIWTSWKNIQGNETNAHQAFDFPFRYNHSNPPPSVSVVNQLPGVSLIKEKQAGKNPIPDLYAWKGFTEPCSRNGEWLSWLFFMMKKMPSSFQSTSLFRGKAEGSYVPIFFSYTTKSGHTSFPYFSIRKKKQSDTTHIVNQTVTIIDTQELNFKLQWNMYVYTLKILFIKICM